MSFLLTFLCKGTKRSRANLKSSLFGLVFLSIALALLPHLAMAQTAITIWAPDYFWAEFWGKFVLPEARWPIELVVIPWGEIQPRLMSTCFEGDPPDIVMLPVWNVEYEIEYTVLYPEEYGVPISLAPMPLDFIRHCLRFSEDEEHVLLDHGVDLFYLIDWYEDRWTPVGMEFAPWLKIVAPAPPYGYRKPEVLELLKIAGQWVPPIYFNFDDALSDIVVEFVDKLTDAETTSQVTHAMEEALHRLVYALQELEYFPKLREDVHHLIPAIYEAIPLVMELIELPVEALFSMASYPTVAAVGIGLEYAELREQAGLWWKKWRRGIEKLWEIGPKPLAAKVNHVLKEVAGAAKSAAIWVKEQWRFVKEEFAAYIHAMKIIIGDVGATAAKAFKSVKDYISRVGRVAGKKFKEAVKVLKGTVKSVGKRLAGAGLIAAFIDVVNKYGEKIVYAYTYCLLQEGVDFWLCVDEALVEQGLSESLVERIVDFFKTLFGIDETQMIMDVLKDC